MNCQSCTENRLTKRTLSTVQWIIPGTVLLLIPKCPFCIAGYVAVFTGIGVSVTAATWLRNGLITLCVASLLFLLKSTVITLYRKHS